MTPWSFWLKWSRSTPANLFGSSGWLGMGMRHWRRKCKCQGSFFPATRILQKIYLHYICVCIYDIYDIYALPIANKWKFARCQLCIFAEMGDNLFLGPFCFCLRKLLNSFFSSFSSHRWCAVWQRKCWRKHFGCSKRGFPEVLHSSN